LLTSFSSKPNIINNLHFLHGNSMTPESYVNLLNQFTDNFNIKCSVLRPLCKNNKFINFNNWDIFLNDYLDSIKNEKDIVGVGHSIGGNLLLKAAICYPEKFKKIFLLDPTFFTPMTIYAWKLISFFNLQSRFLPYIKRAQNKKMEYKNLEQMYESYRKYKVFSNFSNDDLKGFIKSLVIEQNDSYRLVFDRLWDTHIYKTGLVNDMLIWKNIRNFNIECYILQAEYSDTFLNKTKKKVKKLNSSIKILTIKNSDHLFPINNYQETTEILKKYIF